MGLLLFGGFQKLSFSVSQPSRYSTQSCGWWPFAAIVATGNPWLELTSPVVITMSSWAQRKHLLTVLCQNSATQTYLQVKLTLSSRTRRLVRSAVAIVMSSLLPNHLVSTKSSPFFRHCPNKEKGATFVRKATIGETFKNSALTYTSALPQSGVVCLGMRSILALPNRFNWVVSQSLWPISLGRGGSSSQ